MTVRLLQSLRSSSPTQSTATKKLSEESDNTESTCILEEDGMLVSESLETVVVELQHDLRAKSAQCDVLRDTLSAMSNQMKEQESNFDEAKEDLNKQIEKANVEVTKQKRLLAMKQSAWERSEERYEGIIEKKEEEIAEWKSKFDDLMLRFEEEKEKFQQEKENLQQQQQPPKDDLLGSLQKLQASLEEKRQKESAQGANDDFVEDDDSIQAPYGELDATDRPSNFTNRTRPYRRKKRGHPIKKFQMMPMTWIGTPEAQDDVSVPESVPEEAEFNEHMEAMSLADMYTTDDGDLSACEEEENEDVEDEAGDEGNKKIHSVSPPKPAGDHDAAQRRRRIRKAAKKKCAMEGFTIEKLEC